MKDHAALKRRNTAGSLRIYIPINYAGLARWRLKTNNAVSYTQHPETQESIVIFITGLFRSGTTLVQKILDSHPDAQVMNQGLLPVIKLLNNKIKSANKENISSPLETVWFGDGLDRLNLVNNIYINQEEINVALREIKELAEEENLAGQHPGIELYNALEVNLKPSYLNSFLDNLGRSIKIYRGADTELVIGFKELFGSLLAHPLLDSEDCKSKVIQAVRDPRAVLASRNYGNYSGEVAEKYSVYLVSKMWRKSILAKLKLEQVFRSRFYSVRYEDLVRDPEAFVKSIDEFLGLTFDGSQCDTSLFKNEDGKSWKANTSFSIPLGFTTDSVDRWQDILPDDVVGTVEYMCYFEMLAAGYKPRFRESESKKLFRQFSENESEIKDWIRCGGFVLDDRKKTREINRHDMITG